MSRVVWRREEKDFGFRFLSGEGRRADELYQARNFGEFYVVPAAQRKLAKERIKTLVGHAPNPTSPRIVANPWRSYESDWDWITTEDGICLNWAGCLDQEEINRREDEGVQRAMELVAELIQRADPMPLTSHLLQQLHTELMSAIYPFAGRWRTVGLTKGGGPEKWPLPPSGIQPLINELEQKVLSRSPVIEEDDDLVFRYASEVMGEFLAIHPFREGNGRTAFIVGNLVVMQNEMLPLTTYERRKDEARYFMACEAARIYKEYTPLEDLLAEWEDQAFARWEGGE